MTAEKGRQVMEEFDDEKYESDEKQEWIWLVLILMFIFIFMLSCFLFFMGA